MSNSEKRFCPNNILEARKSLNISQKEVAISLSVSAPSVSDWERCLKYPSVENLIQLADLLGTSTDYLLRRSNRTTLTVENFRITPEEQRLIENYRQLNADGRRYIEEQFSVVSGNPKYSQSRHPSAESVG